MNNFKSQIELVLVMDKDIPLLPRQLPDNAMTKQIFAAKLLRDTDLCAKHGSLYS